MGLDLRFGGNGVPWSCRARSHCGRQHQGGETPEGHAHEDIVGASVVGVPPVPYCEV